MPESAHHTGPRQPRGAQGARGAFSLRDAMEGLRGIAEQRAGVRMGRGDVRAAILALLAEHPMHGYQIIRETQERSNGAWRPSPGSVYPTLQLLADEGLVEVREANGRKSYSLTDAGRAEAEEIMGDGLPWEQEFSDRAAQFSALPQAGMRLVQAVAQVGMEGTPEQVDRAVEALDEARRRIYAILAEA